VLAHHERPDGAGYPFGLSAEQIPLEARILAVADAFEAMTADRVYRAGMPRDAAVEELRRCCASQFDEDVVHAFLRGLGAPVGTAFDPAFR
jgi:HD-GYP domain-containing protein (c-di-GMP phosphodiesterase class II)